MEKKNLWTVDPQAKHYNDGRLYEFQMEQQFEEESIGQNQKTLAKDTREPKLYLCQVPDEWSEQAIQNLCSKYGRVNRVYVPKSTKNIYFVYFESLAEAEVAMRKINENQLLKIQAKFAIECNSKNKFYSLKQLLAKPPSSVHHEEVEFVDKLNIEKRRFKGPFGKPQSFNDFTFRGVITNKDYATGLGAADPRREFHVDMIDENVFESENWMKKIVNGRCIAMKPASEKNASPFNYHGVTFDSAQRVFSFSSSNFNNEPFPELEKCFICDKIAGKFCTKCNNHYCSISCRKSDKSHDVFCAGNKIAELDDEKDVTEAEYTYSPFELPVKKIKDSAKLTCIVNPKHLFVRPADKESEIEFLLLMTEAIKYSSTALVLEEFVCGSLILAPFDGLYYRAILMKIEDKENAIVAFVDYGNVCRVKLNELKTISEKLKQFPRFASKIILKNVSNHLFNAKVSTNLMKLMAKDEKLKIKFTDYEFVSGKTECELITEYNEYLSIAINKLNDRLVILNQENYFVARGSGKSIKMDEFHGKNVSVIVTDSSMICYSELSFIRTSELDTFLYNEKRINLIAEHIFVGDDCCLPDKEDMCLVKWSDKWYRAMAYETSDDGFVTVLFVDYGNLNIVNVKSIRKIPEILMFPSLTCTAKCFQDKIDESEEKRLRELFPCGSEIVLDEIERDNEKDQIIAKINRKHFYDESQPKIN